MREKSDYPPYIYFHILRKRGHRSFRMADWGIHKEQAEAFYVEMFKKDAEIYEYRLDKSTAKIELLRTNIVEL